MGGKDNGIIGWDKEAPINQHRHTSSRRSGVWGRERKSSEESKSLQQIGRKWNYAQWLAVVELFYRELGDSARSKGSRFAAALRKGGI